MKKCTNKAIKNLAGILLRTPSTTESKWYRLAVTNACLLIVAVRKWCQNK